MADSSVAFDWSTAKPVANPVEDAPAFDWSTAKPVDDKPGLVQAMGLSALGSMAKFGSGVLGSSGDALDSLADKIDGGARPSVAGNVLRSIGESMTERARAGAQGAKTAQQEALASRSSGFGKALVQGAGMVPAMAATIGTDGLGGAAVFGAQGAGEKYAESRYDRNLSPSEAAKSATISGAADTALGLVPGAKSVEKIAGKALGKAASPYVASAVHGGGVGVGFTEADKIQNAAEFGDEYKPGEGDLSGFIGGAAGGVVGHGISALAGKIKSRNNNLRSAQQDQPALQPPDLTRPDLPPVETASTAPQPDPTQALQDLKAKATTDAGRAAVQARIDEAVASNKAAVEEAKKNAQAEALENKRQAEDADLRNLAEEAKKSGDDATHRRLLSQADGLAEVQAPRKAAAPSRAAVTPDELAVAANAAGVHPDDVPHTALADLLAHAENDPEAAQQLIDTHESDTALASSLSHESAQAPSAEAAPRAAEVEEPARKLPGDDGERRPGTPSREEPSEPEQPGSIEGEVGRVTDRPAALTVNRDGLPIRTGENVGLAAGMAQDGVTTVHDRAKPDSLIAKHESGEGRAFDLTESHDYHERVEKSLLDAGHTYPEAHRAATEAEHARIRQLGFDPNEIEDKAKPFYDEAAHRARALGNTTPEVTGEPYQDSGENAMRADGGEPDPRFVLDRDGGRYTEPVHGKLLNSVETVTAKHTDGGFSVLDPHSGLVLAKGDTRLGADRTAKRMARDLGRRRLQSRLDKQAPQSQQQLRAKFEPKPAIKDATDATGQRQVPQDNQQERPRAAPGQAVSENQTAARGGERRPAERGDRTENGGKNPVALRNTPLQRLKEDGSRHDLITFLRLRGGLNVKAGGGEIRGRLKHLDRQAPVVGLPSIERKGTDRYGRPLGMSLDHAREAATEAGFITPDEHGKSHISDLLNLLYEAEDGRKIYARGNHDAHERELHEKLADMEKSEQNARINAENEAPVFDEQLTAHDVPDDLRSRDRVALADRALRVLGEDETERIAAQHENDDDYFRALEEAVDERVSREDHGRGEGLPPGDEREDGARTGGQGGEGSSAADEAGAATPFELSAQENPKAPAKGPSSLEANSDLFGERPAQRQALADEQQRRDVRRNGTQDAPAGGDDGLFSDRQRQTDVEDQIGVDRPLYSRETPEVRDLGFTLPNGKRFAAAARDDTGARYDYHHTPAEAAAAEREVPRDAAHEALDRAKLSDQNAEQVQPEGDGVSHEESVQVEEGLRRRKTNALKTVEEVKAAAAAGKLKDDVLRQRYCYSWAAAYSKAGLGHMLIGRVELRGGLRGWHAVVELKDGAIFDPVDKQFYEPSVYEKAFGFAPVRSLTPETVRAFLKAHDNLAPDPQNLGLTGDRSIDFSRTNEPRSGGVFHSGGQSVDSLRSELEGKLGKQTLAALEKAGVLKLHADDSTLPKGAQNSGARGVYANRVGHLDASHIAPGKALGTLLHELGVHDSAITRDGALTHILGESAPKLLERFERLKQRGSRLDRELAVKAERLADAEMGQRRREGLTVSDAIRQNETLAHFIERVETHKGGFAVIARKWAADALAAMRAWLLKSPALAKLAPGLREALASKMTGADFVRLAREHVQGLAGAAQAKDRVEAGLSPAFARARYGEPSKPFRAAMDRLLKDRNGEAPAALHNVDVGPIDLVWGKAGTPEKGYSDGYGLAHILAKHPEVDPYALEGIVAQAKEVGRRGNTVQLETPDHHAAIKLDWNSARKKWLLTAFERSKDAAGGSIDVTDNLRSAHPADQASLPSATVDDPKNSRNAPAPTFYSQMQRTLESKLNASGTGEALAKQIEALAANGGFKKEELEWSGVADWLRSKDNVLRKVSRAEVLDYLRANDVQLKEVTNAAANEPYPWVVRDAKNAELNRYATREDARNAAKHYGSGATFGNEGKNDSTKFSTYQLPGGTNYREMLLTLPERIPADRDARRARMTDLARRADGLSPAENAEYDRLVREDQASDTATTFRSPHFDEPNILAHVRMNDRTGPDGEKILHLEEVQSDWGQKGRRDGYTNAAGRAAEARELREIDAKPISERTAEDFSRRLYLAKRVNGVEGITGVPDMPFKQSWPLLAMKRMIRFASENGYDKISWTTGDAQADRYDLSKAIDRVEYSKDGRLVAYKKGEPDVSVIDEQVPRDKIADYVGKEVAEKLNSQPEATEYRPQNVSGIDLKIGGTGMRGFYDRMLPNEVNKYVKKWGAKVGETTITHEPAGTEDPDTTAISEDGQVQSRVHSLDITPAMKKSVVEEGQPLFSRMTPDDTMLRRMNRFVDEFMAKKVRPTDTMILGKTPDVLRAIGAPSMDVEIEGDVLGKAIQGKHSQFGITPEMLKSIPKEIADPAMIFRSATHADALLVITSLSDRLGDPVAVAVHLNKRSGRLVVNRIESIHSRQDGEARMVRDAKDGRLAYYNDEALARPTTVPLYLGKVVQAAQGPTSRLVRRSSLVKPPRVAESGSSETQPSAGSSDSGGGQSLFSRGDGMDTDASRKEQADNIGRAFGVGNEAALRVVGRGAIGHAFAVLQRVSVQAERGLKKWRDSFDAMLGTEGGRQAIRNAVQEWETGAPVSDPSLAPFFRSMKDAFDQRVQAVIGSGRQLGYIENYFPHLYKDPKRAAEWTKDYLARRPLEGGKGWTKERFYETLEAAREAGLEPISDNPVDLVQAHLHQLDKFVALHQIRTDLESRGIVRDDNPDSLRKPAGWAKVDDPAFRGKLVPEVIAKDINTLLGPSLMNSAAFRVFRKAENSLVSAALGLSGFHAMMTTGDTIAAHIGDAIQRAAIGDVAGTAKSLGNAVISPVLSPIKGKALVQQSLGETPSGLFTGMLGMNKPADAHTAALLRMLEQGGHQISMSPTELNDSAVKLGRLLRSKEWQNGLKGAATTATEAGHALLENITPLIHKHLVPSQKMTAKVLGLKFELDALANRLTDEHGNQIQRGDYAAIEKALREDAIRQIAGKVVQQVDDRLGQMNYRNLYMNRVSRDILQAAFMSPGWQIGTVRTIGGGIADLKKLAKGGAVIHGPLDKLGMITDAKMTRLTSRTAYLVGLHALVAGLSTGITYALTGQGPGDDLRNYYTIRTGRKNDDGSDERLSFPSYLKDEVELLHGGNIPKNLAHMAGNKLNPVFRVLADLSHNTDFFGNRVYDPDADSPEQAKQIGIYLAKAAEPFSVSGITKSLEAGKSYGEITANLMGINPAPAYMTASPFTDYLALHRNDHGRQILTPEQADHKAEFNRALHDIRSGREPDVAGLTYKEQKKLYQYEESSAPEAHFKRLTLGQKLLAWERASDEERRSYHLQAHIFSGGLAKEIGELPESEQGKAEAELDAIGDWRPAGRRELTAQ